MHRDGHQDLRLHPCDVRPVLARRQEQGGGVRRGRRHGGDGGAAGQLHDQVRQWMFFWPRLLIECFLCPGQSV